ncbi:MAG: ComEC family competence protein [Alphaproteobacteria bacterium]|nr:ComEC family competence protein [Alphaproteobacteria bacterium]NCQ66435.1 ComEC family competence protein [Alphaproteobacteria bacterium]
MYHKFGLLLRSFGRKVQEKLEQEEKNLFYWVPVCYGLGIALYFNLKTEPSLKHSLIPFGAGCLLYLFTYVKKYHWRRKFALAFLLVSLGFLSIKARTEILNTPMLVGEIGFQPLTGTLKSIERLPNRTRIVLEDVRFLKKLRSDLPLPTKIRLSLRGRLQPADDFIVGDQVRLKASLSPPGNPVAPHAYDFRRRAYFEGIGAVGYGITPLTRVDTEGLPQNRTLYGTLKHTVNQWRTDLTTYLRRHIKGQSGAVVAALVTGDRSGITDNTRQAFADAGLAHILAISGLHLSIVAGLIFFLIRGSLCLIPPIALKQNTKKLAAGIALVFTFCYLILSGATIPAERAFIMTSLILIAVMVDRVALTMRNVALAALLVLIIAPDVLTGPSFQLSFAAVIGLVAAYEKMHPFLSRWHARVGESRFAGLKKTGLYLSTLLFSSLIATLATAPFTIFTFNRFSLVAVLTNLIAIPYVSFVIMPLIVFALLTAPFTVFFTGPLLEQVLQALITLSFESQKLPGAVILVPQVSTIVQMSVILGLLWIALWTTKWRRLGVIPLAMGGLLFMLDRPPDVYIAPEQNLIGYYDGQEKKAWVNTLQSGRFARKAWLQLVGAPQVLKLTDKNKCDHYTATATEGCHRITKGNTRLHFTQKHLMKWHKKIYTLTVDVEKEGRNSPLLLSQDFKKNGAYFLWVDEKGITTQSVKDISGNRPWR